MTNLKLDLTTEEITFLKRQPESWVLKWAYHLALPADGEWMEVKAVREEIHRLVDPIYESIMDKTDGYTPYDNGVQVSSNEDAIGAATQFFGKLPQGKEWVTRNGRHRYNEDGWSGARDYLYNGNDWEMWTGIVTKVEIAYATVEAPDVVDQIIAISCEENTDCDSVFVQGYDVEDSEDDTALLDETDEPDVTVADIETAAYNMELTTFERFVGTIETFMETAREQQLVAMTSQERREIMDKLKVAIQSTCDLM